MLVLTGQVSSLSTTAAPVCSQRRRSSGVPTTSLRPCHGRPCNSALAASTTACGLQGRCHGVPRAARSRAIISESVGSCRWLARPSPTSIVIVAPATCATIPADNCRSTYIYSRCITTIELTAPDIQSSSLPNFCQRLKTFLFRQSFPDIGLVLWLYYASVDFVRALAILATLKVFDWHWHWLTLITCRVVIENWMILRCTHRSRDRLSAFQYGPDNPQNCPFPWKILTTSVHGSLDPRGWLTTQTASRSPRPFVDSTGMWPTRRMWPTVSSNRGNDVCDWRGATTADGPGVIRQQLLRHGRRERKRQIKSPYASVSILTITTQPNKDTRRASSRSSNTNLLARPPGITRWLETYLHRHFLFLLPGTLHLHTFALQKKYRFLNVNYDFRSPCANASFQRPGFVSRRLALRKHVYSICSTN